ncbi:chaplin [Streptomyces sp. 8N616]|uniref:chaplin n=1 Tax=Streptomyces sp. 8N616 TaxID=3457414 RepID=UPI003FD4D304
MKNLKKVAVVAMIAGGIVAAGAGVASATDGANAYGETVFSPGTGSGNQVQAPVHVPVNATGNSVNVIGVLNPTFGNESANF